MSPTTPTIEGVKMPETTDTTPDEPQITPAEDWPDPADLVKILTLPSGNVAKVSPPAFALCMMREGLPPHLRAIAKKHVANGKDWTGAEQEQLLNWLLTLTFVEPKVVLATKAKAGELSISRISDRDKEAVAVAMDLGRYLVPAGAGATLKGA